MTMAWLRAAARIKNSNFTHRNFRLQRIMPWPTMVRLVFLAGYGPDDDPVFARSAAPLVV
jgi:hypothetical protein